MTDDGALIQAYVQFGSEPAFAELVRKHLDLVYSTALRVLAGDEHLARDICQTVFIDLFAKATRLADRKDLAGWLYTSACFAAAKAVRSAKRRSKREQISCAMTESPIAENEKVNWDDIRPILDSLMLQLKDTDREALLLRFFQNRSLAELGQRLGLSDNAARMRVERALERLRVLLVRNGINSTAVAIAVTLAQEAVQAAPPGLAGTITANTLAAATISNTFSILNLTALMKTKTIVIGLCLTTAGVSFVAQHRTNQRLHEQIVALQAQLAEAATSKGLDNPEPNPRPETDAELLRLRAEVAGLRQGVASQPKSARASEEPVKAAKLANEQKQRVALLAKSPEIPMTPAAQWTNAGFASPAAALQTVNWAIAKGDMNALSSGLMWDAQTKARVEVLFASAPESVRQSYGSVDGLIASLLLNNSTPIAAGRVLSQTDEGTRETTLLEQRVFNDGGVRESSFQFEQQDDGQWRQVLPADLVPKLAILLGKAALDPSAVSK